jgi:hypothetical protein
LTKLARAAACLAVALTALGCGSDDEQARAPEPLPIPDGCNPLAADWDCLLPYPSDHFLVDDGKAGRKVELGEGAKLLSGDGSRFDLFGLHSTDGWPIGTQILALFPGGVRGDDLVGYYDGDPAGSISDQSPTLLIDAESGERVLHFAELDPRAESDERRALVIRPSVRLRPGARHVVAIRRLVDASGVAIAPPEGFRRLRDRQTRGDPVLGPLSERYESELFPVLEAAGVTRSELVLAWDFSVRSEQDATRDLLTVRSDVLTRLASGPPEVSVVDVQDAPKATLHRRINLSVKVPLYVESTEPMARLNRDVSGNVVASGHAEVPFSVLIPKSVGERPPGSPPARLLQFGHGFFGSREEAMDYPAELGNERGFVIVAADWWGMADQDRVKVIDRLHDDPGSTLIFTDRLHQAMANFMFVSAAARGAVASLPELTVAAGPAYDPSALYFYGISMGHILGGTYVALAPEVERAVLGVGGSNFSLMLFRAQPFALFLMFIGGVVPDPLEQQKLGAMMQTSFDRIESLTYAPHVRSDTYPDSPASRQILLQIGVGDPAVPNIAAHLHARALGLDQLAPAPRALAAIEPRPGPLDSALVEFDFGISPWPDRFAIPTPQDESNKVHDSVRRLEAAKQQIDLFFRPGGMVEATCDGVCDPE